MATLKQWSKKWFSKNYGYRSFILLIFYSLIVLSRNLLETGVFSAEINVDYYRVLYHFSWYNSVLFWMLMSFKYINGTDKEQLEPLKFAGLLLYVPLIYSFFTGNKLRLQHFKDGSFQETVINMLTLCYGHELNHPVFWELVILISGMTMLSFYLSRSLLRTIGTVIVGFYGSFFIAGVYLFGTEHDPDAFLKIPTSFYNYELFASFFISFFVICFSVYHFAEIYSYFKYLKKVRQTHSMVLTISISTLFFPLFIGFILPYFRDIESRWPDYLLAYIPFVTLFLSGAIIIKSERFSSQQLYALFFGVLTFLFFAGFL